MLCSFHVKLIKRDFLIQNFNWFTYFVFANFVVVVVCAVKKGIVGVKCVTEIEGQPVISWF